MPHKHSRITPPNSRSRSLLVALLVVSSIGGIGAYAVLRSEAQSAKAPDNAITIVGVGNTSVSAEELDMRDTTYNEADNTATYNTKVDFQKGEVPLYLFAPIGVYLNADDRLYNKPRQVDDWHISIGIQMYAKVTDVVCAPGYVCQIDRSGYSAGDGGRVDKVQMMDMCINLTRQDYNKAFTLLTLKIDPSTAVKRPYGPDWTVQTTAERNRCVPTDQLSKTDGNLAYNRGYDWQTYVLPESEGRNSSATGGKTGAWGTNGTSTGQAGLVQPGATGSGNTGSGNAGTGTGGAGGGGSGSTAKTQTDTPNTIPASTTQGDNKQPDLNPSPFFDGKQYEPGSAADSMVATAFSFAGRKVAYGWIYLVTGLLAAGGGGYYLWRKKRT